MNTLVKVTLAEQAHRELRARIVSGKLRGGERLLPNELAADLGISPTPVKEACLKLEADGLVVNSSRRGMVVRDFTVEDVEELYAARMLLEKGAVEVAFDAGQRFQVAGVGQLVEVEDLMVRLVQQVSDESRTDETGSAGDKDAHVVDLL